jgi:serine protease
MHKPTVRPTFVTRLVAKTSSLTALTTTLFIAVALLSNQPPQPLAARTGRIAPTLQQQTRVTDQLIIRFANGATNAPAASEAIESRIAALGSQTSQAMSYVGEHMDGTHVLKLHGRLDANQLAELVQKMRDNAAALGIESVEVDELRFVSLIPNDTSYAQQWDMQAVGSGSYGINATAAWDITTGSANYSVAVVDTGIRLNHPDLLGRTVPGYDFIHDALVGNDGNMRDADPSDPGDWITSGESASGYFSGCPARPSSWHGSHVAGTIGAGGYNNTGIAGVNWESRILPIRALGKCGGYDTDIIAGVRWAAGINVAGVPANAYPARVINLSLGGYNSTCNPSSNPDAAACKCPPTWQAAISEVTAKGALVVVAAGNEELPARASVPANCSGVISVAATNKQGDLASYSNYDNSITLSAPGGESAAGILSTIDTGVRQPMGPAYDEYSGTSMAAPHVAGIASLMISLNPALTPAQITQMLRASVTAFPSGSNCTTAICGTGIANAANAVLAARNTLPATTTPGPTSTADPRLTVRTYLPVAWRK